MNEYINELGKNPRAGGRFKKADCETCVLYIRKALKNTKIKSPFVIHYGFYEQNARRDRMNVFSYFDKIFEDSLQKAGTIQNDGWHDVIQTTHDFFIDQKYPRVVIEIEEVKKEKRQYFKEI